MYVDTWIGNESYHFILSNDYPYFLLKILVTHSGNGVLLYTKRKKLNFVDILQIHR